jgi:hypothetical protein
MILIKILFCIGFLCSLSSNTYGLEFLNFTIRDGDSKKKLFEITKDKVFNSLATAVSKGAKNISLSDPDNYRKIAYGELLIWKYYKTKQSWDIL